MSSNSVILKRTFDSMTSRSRLFMTDIWYMLPKGLIGKNLLPFVDLFSSSPVDILKYERRLSKSYIRESNIGTNNVDVFLVSTENVVLYAPYFLALGANVYSFAKYNDEYVVTKITKDMRIPYVRFGILKEKTRNIANLVSFVLSLFLESTQITYTSNKKIMTYYEDDEKRRFLNDYLLRFKYYLHSELYPDILDYDQFSLNGGGTYPKEDYYGIPALFTDNHLTREALHFYTYYYYIDDVPSIISRLRDVLSSSVITSQQSLSQYLYVMSKMSIEYNGVDYDG